MYLRSFAAMRFLSILLQHILKFLIIGKIVTIFCSAFPNFWMLHELSNFCAWDIYWVCSKWACHIEAGTKAYVARSSLVNFYLASMLNVQNKSEFVLGQNIV